MIRVLVSGAAGRMGREVVSAVAAASDMEVVAAFDPANIGAVVDDMRCLGDLAALIASEKPDVMVDFTRPDVVESNLRIALAAGVDCVVGTTGLSEERLEELASLAPAGTTLFFAPNFTIGAVLMMRFSEMAARFMPSAEVVELHHDKKLDAPSGTAIRTARMIAAARQEVPSVPGAETELDGMHGARGALVDGVPVHSVRMAGYVAHQEVIFGSAGQTLTIRHDSIDRSSYMPGVILAIREVGARSGCIVGLEKLMGE